MNRVQAWCSRRIDQHFDAVKYVWLWCDCGRLSARVPASLVSLIYLHAQPCFNCGKSITIKESNGNHR